ncbi:hypothetical protein MNEG_8962 [Monoraphidium neglectum]|jgi:hypothetical protein|uniref:Uncharacterized protein n=1 Tax=Monoraphidium neglectum TaxID=145388 RepID=A0A0D2M6G3_9CHLO|nr:hypothetical protein MNEG_8962 [Monoraphidium neglectum]KIY99004.1 hypothetical protein MNEG_8962 [Monoraphidium neglectum]|eukprot:XP_013898024.1 hypothetical protein MNEG_8962 [Monoraphidium neglectum]
MDPAVQAAVEAIQSGRLPSDEDTIDVATLLVRAATAPETPAAAAAAARAAFIELFHSDAHAAAAVAALLEPAARQALVAALEGGGHAALDAAQILLGVTNGSPVGGVYTLDTRNRIAGTAGMIESMVIALGRFTRAVLTLPEADSDRNLQRAFRGLCYVLERFRQCDGCAARIFAAPGGVGAIVAAGRAWGPQSGLTFITIMRLFQALINVGADAARALLAEEGVLGMVVKAAGAEDDHIVTGALTTLRLVASADAEIAGRIITDAPARAALTCAAVTGTACEKARAAGRDALRAIARAGHAAAVAVALRPCLAAPADNAERGRVRKVLMTFLPAPAVDVLEAVTREEEVEAAALRAEVAELRAIPVNKRAAIIELAAAVRATSRR